MKWVWHQKWRDLGITRVRLMPPPWGLLPGPEEQMTYVPTEFLRRPDVEPTLKHTYVLLLRYACANEDFPLTLEFLTMQLRIPLEDLQAQLAQLEGLQLIVLRRSIEGELGIELT